MDVVILKEIKEVFSKMLLQAIWWTVWYVSYGYNKIKTDLSKLTCPRICDNEGK